MGQSNDDAPFTPVDELSIEDAANLRQAAVAIDPPPRGALGIRELLEFLEKEAAKGFPADTDERPEPDAPVRPPRRIEVGLRRKGQ